MPVRKPQGPPPPEQLGLFAPSGAVFAPPQESQQPTEPPDDDIEDDEDSPFDVAEPPDVDWRDRRYDIPVVPGLPDDTPLAAAREHLIERLTEGATCPCCAQHARVYRRRLNATMTAIVVWLVARSGSSKAWVDVPAVAPRWVVSTNQTGTASKWGLIERRGNVDDRKKHSGIWRPTDLGIAFVHGRATVPKHVFLYDNHVLAVSGETIGVFAALSGSKFDYAELMGHREEDSP
jgi:hypothetical protein